MTSNDKYGVDFWLDLEKYNDCLSDNNGGELTFDVNLIKLASIRKSISNFVRILTRKKIQVLFNDSNVNRNELGKLIRISAKINSKSDFDVAVGLALHEGAHSLLSDFDILLNMFANIPDDIFKLSDSIKIRRVAIEKFIHNIFNVVEDRYIDNYIFNNTPGYRGYYSALYLREWEDADVDRLLKSDEYKWPSLESYLFRILNLTNPNTDLLALPRLDDIADVIDFSNMDRLKTSMDRVNVAFDVVRIALDCIEEHNSTPMSGSNGDSNDDAGTLIISEISDIISGRNKLIKGSKYNDSAENKISDVENDELKELHKSISEKQQKFLMGKIEKDKISLEAKDILDLIELHGITFSKVGEGLFKDEYDNVRINCIVVKKMTRELIFRGRSIFPLSKVLKMGSIEPSPSPNMEEAVNAGIRLGIKLGRKLQLRREVNPQKIVRQKSGKINKRQLHEAAFDAEDIFFKLTVESYPIATLHITVDASTSMIGDKWIRTMTSVVAICKAASMVENIHVSVSFRTTHISDSGVLPYIVMAYDSKVDKFSKVKNLFPYLSPNGCTPEGLAIEAIMGLFNDISPDEEEKYLLNLSDGEPYFPINIPSLKINMLYSKQVGVSHTKSQINKIRKRGVEILSYFIWAGVVDSDLESNFKEMYGKSAKFINVNSIVELARTINERFLSKQD